MYACNEVGHVLSLRGAIKVWNAEAQKMILDVCLHLCTILQRLGSNLLPTVGVGHYIVDVALQGGPYLFACSTMHVACEAFGVVIVENGRDALLTLRCSPNALVDAGHHFRLFPKYDQPAQLLAAIAANYLNLLVIPFADHLLELCKTLELPSAFGVGKLQIDEPAR